MPNRPSLPPHLVHVDDDPRILSGLARRFRKQGWRATSCRDGAAALVVLVREPTQLLLVDLALEDADGRDLVRAARARHPELHIAVLTGSDPESVDASCKRAGANRVLHKLAPIEEILDLAAPPAPPPLVVPLRLHLDRHLVRALEVCKGNLTWTATALQISVNTLKSHLRRLHRLREE